MDPDHEVVQLDAKEGAKEMSLTTVMDKPTMEDRRMHWNYSPSYSAKQDSKITLAQLEIKTFQYTMPSL